MTRPRSLPKLPDVAFSVLGPIPVTTSDELVDQESALGLTEFRPRTIEIDAGSGRVTQWQTYWHEVVHVALWDGGIHQGLTHEQRECVCDALGTYLTAMMQAGLLKVPRVASYSQET